MDKKMIIEYMKGHYKDCEIEEVSLFVDGLLPMEEKENNSQLSKPISVVTRNNKGIAPNTHNLMIDNVVKSDDVSCFDCIYCDEKTKYYGYQEDGIKVYVCENCRHNFLGKCDYSEVSDVV